jgi:hypothetical protein
VGVVGVLVGVFFGPVLQLSQCRHGAASEIRQTVLDCRWATGVHGAGDHSASLKLSQRLREHLVADATGAPAQLGPALRSIHEINQD